MIIRRLQVENFKCFERGDWRFEPGLNVIFGPNEAGKSSIREALLLALFGNAGTASGEVRGKASWGGNGGFKLLLEIEDAGRQYKVVRDFAEKLNSLWEPGQEAITNKTAIAEQVARLVGTSSQDLYCATACIAHENLADLRVGTEIGERLRSVNVGCDDVALQALKALDSAIADLSRGMDRHSANPGELARLRAEMDELARKLADAEAALSQASSSRSAASRAEAELAATQADFEAVQSTLSAYERRHAVEERLNEAKRRESDLDGKIERVNALEAKLAEARRKMEKLGGDVNLQDESELADICSQLCADERSLAARERRISELETQAAALRGPRRTCTIGTVFGLFVLAGGAAATFFNTRAWPLIALGFLIAAFAFWRRRNLGIGIISARMAAEREAAAELRGRIESAMDDRVRSAMEDFSCSDASELQALLGKRHAVQDELEKASAELAGLLDGRARDDLERERKERSVAKRDAMEELESPDLMAGVLSPVDYQKLSQRRSELQARIDRLDEQKREAQAAARAAPIDAAEVARLSEELEVKKQRLAAQEHRLSVYRMTADHIRRAISETLTEAKPAVERAVSEYIKRITDGRYTKASVEVSDKGLQVALDSPLKGGLAETDELSRGTADQLYLAARLGLVRYVFGGAHPPLILDDPFVTFDDERFQNALALLQEFAKEYQILLFTCHPDYERLGLEGIKLRR